MIVEVRETQDGFYWQECNRSAKMIPTHAGIIPDAVELSWATDEQTSANAPKRMGIFADEMAQNIITQVVNFQLDMVLFDGDESPTFIRNLRHTLVPDIAPHILFLKTIHQNEPENYQPYEDCVDYLLFDP